MKNIVKLRSEYARNLDLESRKQIAKEELSQWSSYLDERKNDLPNPDFHIEDKDLSLLRENFDRFKVIYLLSPNLVGQENNES